MRLMTKFELFWLSKYLVETWLVDLDIYKLIESAMSVRRITIDRVMRKKRIPTIVSNIKISC